MAKQRVTVTTKKFTTSGSRAKSFAKASRGAGVMAARQVVIPTAARGMVRNVGYYGRGLGSAQEMKFHDLDIDDAVIAQNGNIVQASCNLIAQGVTESTRVGRKCVIKSINWRFRVLLNEVNDAANPSPGDVVRIIVYQDRQCNGATATVLGLLETDNFQSFNNLANKNRFLTLMDRTYTMNALTLSADAAGNFDAADMSINDTFFKKCNIPIEFDNTTGAITEIRSNNIGVLLLSNIGVSGLDSKMRLRFTDS